MTLKKTSNVFLQHMLKYYFRYASLMFMSTIFREPCFRRNGSPKMA